jgi:A/G-specific adenine glycosylase
MDIGSLICKKSEPLCLKCPVNQDCFSYKKNNIKKISFKKKVSLKKENIWTVLIIDNQERIFLKKLSYKNLWKGLYSSPVFLDKHDMKKWIDKYDLQHCLSSTIWKFSHKLSHINFLFNVHICKIISNKKISLMGDNWYNLSDIKFGMPKYQDKIITEYINNYD